MGTERDRTRRSGDLGLRHQELLRSLHAAVDTLTVCVERIEDLIIEVDRQMIEGSESVVGGRRPAQVSFGGGPSVIGFRDATMGSGERRRGLERRAMEEERRLVDDRRLPRQRELPDPGMPALMAASEMVHLGYSREEIERRLQARWGERAAAILREALD